MGESVLKTSVIHTAILLIVTALTFILVLIPAYVHYAAGHIPGAYDALYLSRYSPYSTIVVEVDYQPGMKPDLAAINTLQQQIELYSGKDVVIYLSDEIEDNEVPDIIFGDDIFATASKLQKAHRDYHTGWFGGNITLYVMYLDTLWHPANLEYSSSSLKHSVTTRVYSVGVTYAADSIIIFKSSLMDEDLETTILLHELGHIWGLDHSSRSDNVMSAEFNVFSGAPASHNPKLSEFPKDFSLRDKQKLARLQQSPHILPFF